MTPTHAATDRFHYPRHGAIVAGFSAVVAIGLSIAKGGDWMLQFVYAEAIGLSIWACTDFGRLLFKLDPESNWPIGWRAVVLQVGSIAIGYIVGTLIGDLVCQCSSFGFWHQNVRVLAGYLILCIAI